MKEQVVKERTFVNGNYEEHSQATEGYMLRGFFLEDSFWGEDRLQRVLKEMNDYVNEHISEGGCNG